MILNTGDNLSISAGNCYVHCTLYAVHCTKADRTPKLLILIVSHSGEIQYKEWGQSQIHNLTAW